MIDNIRSKYYFPILLKIYKTVMITLSLAIVLISIWDLVFTINQKVGIFIGKLDWFIWGIFIIDLLVNLKLAENKKKYMKTSLIEIAIITPFAVFLKLPVYLRNSKIIQKTGVLSNPVKVTPGKTAQAVINKINLLLSQKFIIRSFAFLMKPSVIRISKFLNLSKSYLKKTKDKPPTSTS